MKYFVSLGIATAMFVGVWVSVSQAATKFPVCHFDRDTNSYEQIYVGSLTAQTKHLANHQYAEGGDSTFCMIADQ